MCFTKCATANLHYYYFCDGAQLLQDAGCLTSQIIDVRIQQLQAENPNSFYFNTSFFGLLCPQLEPVAVDYQRVEGWTKQARLPGSKTSLFNYSPVFFPIKEGNSHWVLVVADFGMGSLSLSFFDSMSTAKDGSRYLQAVKEFLMEEGQKKGWGGVGTLTEFTMYPETPSRVPRQSNSRDCGVLMLHYMHELSKPGCNVR
jgi:Ulp1 family protease